jgi:hypothetical protein
VPDVIVPTLAKDERVVTALFTNVPDVGRVTLVVPVTVNVVLNAPEVVKFPPSVIVLDPLLTPVPPYVDPNSPPRDTAPFVAELGVNPVDPPLKLVTATPDGNDDDHEGAEPVFPIRICPVIPAAVTCNADELFPYTIPLAVKVVAPVPPCATVNDPLVTCEAAIAMVVFVAEVN